MLKLFAIGLAVALNLTAARIAASGFQSNLTARSTAELRSMAVNGDVNAQFELGVRLVYGTGINPDLTESADWMRRAAENKNTEAQVVLATLYAKGRGVPHDDAMSAHWMRQAAELGQVNCQPEHGPRGRRHRSQGATDLSRYCRPLSRFTVVFRSAVVALLPVERTKPVVHDRFVRLPAGRRARYVRAEPRDSPSAALGSCGWQVGRPRERDSSNWNATL